MFGSPTSDAVTGAGEGRDGRVQDEIHVRPLRWRAYSLVAAGALLVVFTVAGLPLSGTTANGVVLTFSDHLVMIGVGILLAGRVALLGARPNARADGAGV